VKMFLMRLGKLESYEHRDQALKLSLLLECLIFLEQVAVLFCSGTDHH